jgi:hypothetical protein
LQNELNIDMLPQFVRLENVMHVPLANYPHRYVLFDNGSNRTGHIWNGTDPLPRVGISVWIPQRGSQLVVKNWQGTGQDYLLFYRQQLGSNPAWYSANHQHAFNAPVQGLTMLQSWERFGLSYAGDVLKESEAVELDGLVYGLARPGLSVSFPPPRAIVTFPTMREPASVVDGYVNIVAIITGDPNAASDVMMVSVDGERPFALRQSEYAAHHDDRSFNTTHTAPGIHDVKVWRTQKGNPTVAIAGSEYISHYCVGSCPPTQ